MVILPQISFKDVHSPSDPDILISVNALPASQLTGKKKFASFLTARIRLRSQEMRDYAAKECQRLEKQLQSFPGLQCEK